MSLTHFNKRQPYCNLLHLCIPLCPSAVFRVRIKAARARGQFSPLLDRRNCFHKLPRQVLVFYFSNGHESTYFGVLCRLFMSQLIVVVINNKTPHFLNVDKCVLIKVGMAKHISTFKQKWCSERDCLRLFLPFPLYVFANKLGETVTRQWTLRSRNIWGEIVWKGIFIAALVALFLPYFFSFHVLKCDIYWVRFPKMVLCGPSPIS